MHPSNVHGAFSSTVDDIAAHSEELFDGGDDGVAEAVGAPFGPFDDLGRYRTSVRRTPRTAGWRDHDLVFTKVDGSPIHPGALLEGVRPSVERWSLPHVHDLRHGWTTMALEAGVNPKVVSERLGHSGIAITLDTYSHVSEPMQSRRYARLPVEER
jgi:integrase